MYKYLLLLILLFFGGLFVNAQEFPPINIYSPQDYNAENQNWSISQGSNKFIYVANNKGLLEFNGSNWQLYKSPNQTIQRSVEVINDKIYAGYYMDFGYWQKDDYGLLNYTSLSENVKMIEDEQIWKISSLKNFVVFQSLNRIYIYDALKQTFKIIDSKEVILKMFKVENDIYFQKNGIGLFKLINGEPVLFSNQFGDDRIINIFSLKNQLVLVTENKGFFTYENQQWLPWSTDLDKLSDGNAIYSALKLSNDNYLLGTISNGIIVVNEKGALIYQIDQSNGLGNNTVLSLFEDVSKNLWLGLDRGINSIKFNSPYKIFTDHNGDLGTVYTSLIYNDIFYLGTNQGLFWKPLNSSKSFSLIESTQGQVWSLKVIDSTLFCGHNNGTFKIVSNSATKIGNLQGTWDFKKLSDNFILQGNYNGLSVLIKKNEEWVFSHQISGFDISTRYFEIENNSLLVNHEYKGLYKLTLNSSLTQVKSIKSFDSVFKRGSSSSLVSFNNNTYYANTNGVFKYYDSKFIKQEKLSQIFSTTNFISGKLVSTDGFLWAFTKDHILALEPGNLSNDFSISKIPFKSTFREIMTGFENVSQLEDLNYLFGTSFGYIKLDLASIDKNKDDNNLLYLSIDKVEASNQNSSFKPILLSKYNALNFNENNYKFTFSVPFYGKYEQVEYSFILDEFESKWSDWNSENTQVYKNLPHGDYTFNVKAKIGSQELDAQEYIFSINKPWYLSTVMLIIYIIGFVLFSLLMHFFYTNYFKRKQELALEKTKQELSFRELENEQQLTAFKNEKLQQDIESKNRELAISTMSIIKKNEFLNTIKKELIVKNNSNTLDKVIKLLDKNINNSNDWEFFEEAFNNADKNFFNKVKNIHPNLTPTDLKLCAYLRLNLSSKEIAPLLNISPKSVEVKRYRLRKKMELDHDASLTNYILEI
jgi:AraC family chitin signaling transcriptional activator